MSVDLLFIGAHPDDVEFSCGGWVAAAAARGQRVAVLDLTRGELATNGTPEVRAQEAATAAGILGVALRENLGLPDGGVAATDEAVAALVAVVRRLEPALLIGPWVEARHPDHASAGRLVERAHFLGGLTRFGPGPPWRARRLIRYPQRQEIRPDFVVDITAQAATKAAAIAAHVSQLGGAATLVNQPVGAGAWEVRDRYWGATIGVAFGEPYLLGAPVPLSDPLVLGPEPALMPPR